MDTVQIERNRLYTLDEVAALVNANHTCIYRWVKRGLLPYRRMGWMLIISGNDLIDTLARHERGEVSLNEPRYNSLRVPVAV